MNRNQIMAGANRNLSARLDGVAQEADLKLLDATQKIFQVRVKNNNANSIILALNQTFYKPLGTCKVKVPTGVDAETGEPTYTEMDTPFCEASGSVLTAAGYKTDLILTDGTFDGVEMEAIDPTFPVAALKEYVKSTDLRISSMTVESKNRDAFYSQALFAKDIEPFSVAKISKIELSRYLSTDQFISDRIDVPFGTNPVEMSLTSLFRVIIPAKTEVKYTLRFL